MNDDPEIVALTSVYTALKGLDGEAQQRVLDYVARKLGLANAEARGVFTSSTRDGENGAESEAQTDSQSDQGDEDHADMAGISPVAQKWMRRSDLTVEQLGALFTLGVDEIDLVAKCVPGNSKNARTRSVALLKGMAAYLSSGAPRITNEQIKEACLHYDAYDSPNHAKYLKRMSAELSGSKSSGFILTARGLTAGTELIKEMLGLNQDQ